MLQLSTDAVLMTLFAVSFVAATVVPGGSELALIAALHRAPGLLWPAIVVATAGNTLGSMTSYWLGRLLPQRMQHAAVARVRRHGYWILLLAWMPVIGDALAVGAGWLRLNPWISMAALAAGKLARYLLVAGAWIGFEALLTR